MEQISKCCTCKADELNGSCGSSKGRGGNSCIFLGTGGGEPEGNGGAVLVELISRLGGSSVKRNNQSNQLLAIHNCKLLLLRHKMDYPKPLYTAIQGDVSSITSPWFLDIFNVIIQHKDRLIKVTTLIRSFR